MTFPFSLTDRSTGDSQRVSVNGEAVTASREYTEPYYVRLSVDDQIYNVVPGKVGRRFVQTAILIAASKAIVGDKTVQIYESLFPDSGAHDKDILQVDVSKNEKLALTIDNSATQNGRSINANCDDSEIDITIWGYYVDA